MVGDDNLTIDVLIGPADMARALRRDVAEGLSATPKQLPPKWFYDERGSKLFDEITRLPEYYLTARERVILEARSQQIAERSDATTVVELGSGTSSKTRILLDAFAAHGSLETFAPFDVSEETLRNAAAEIAGSYPGIHIHAVAADFDHHLGDIPNEGRRLILFLGSTIGNLDGTARKWFLNELATGMRDGDSLLVGVDLIKDVARMESAYNDSRGVTAEFNKNVLEVINRELHGTFDLDLFDHRARFEPENDWVAMYLEARVAHEVGVHDIDLEIAYDAGELMRTEISTKFTKETIESDVAGAGLEPIAWWTDPDADFALSLAVAR